MDQNIIANFFGDFYEEAIKETGLDRLSTVAAKAATEEVHKIITSHKSAVRKTGEVLREIVKIEADYLPCFCIINVDGSVTSYPNISVNAFFSGQGIIIAQDLIKLPTSDKAIENGWTKVANVRSSIRKTTTTSLDKLLREIFPTRKDHTLRDLATKIRLAVQPPEIILSDDWDAYVLGYTSKHCEGCMSHTPNHSDSRLRNMYPDTGELPARFYKEHPYFSIAVLLDGGEAKARTLILDDKYAVQYYGQGKHTNTLSTELKDSHGINT